MRSLGLLVVFIGAVLVVALFYIYTGAFNVAATSGHSVVGEWVFGTTMENSVKARADQAPAPPENLPTLAGQGLRSYREMCVVCHGAPGVEPREIGKGLTPEPPELAKAAERWSPRELFWIIKHGIKMTGMPAWGPTHKDEEIWPIVAFVQRLPETTPESYQQMVQQLPEQAEGHRH